MMHLNRHLNDIERIEREAEAAEEQAETNDWLFKVEASFTAYLDESGEVRFA